MPIQSKTASGITGTIEIITELAGGLIDLDGFSHIFVIYSFHECKPGPLMVKPFLDTVERGIFSTRAPARPNCIGLSIMKLLFIENNILHIECVDALDGTPVLDIKPYVPYFDSFPDAKTGWITDKEKKASLLHSDNRFKN